jgi:hypothetical protein
MGCIFLRKIHYFRMFEAFTCSWLWGAASCAASGREDWIQKVWIVTCGTKPAISYRVIGFVSKVVDRGKMAIRFSDSNVSSASFSLKRT